jgi:beta-lactamase regulating signal transducer with metallopeptidase domain
MDLDLLMRTSGMLLAALAFTRLLRRATAATRHLVWHSAVIAVVLAPAMILVAPRFELTVPEWFSASLALPAVEQAPAAFGRATPCDAADGCLPMEIALDSIRLDSIATLARAGTWILGGWFLLGWLASGWQAARATVAPLEWTNDARRLAARLGFRRVPLVRQTRQPGSPRVAGFYRPVILLPDSADEWTSADREAALLHELSHIRRADRRTQALAQLACALYWFNPLTWIAAGALARERERACDDEVLKAGIRPSAYASLLLDLARRRHTWTPAATLGMARPSTIEGRLLAILSTEPENVPASTRPRKLSSLRSTRWLVIAGSIVVVATVLGAQQQRPSAASEASDHEPRMVGPMLMKLDDREDPSPITKALTRALDDPDRQVREQAALGLALVPGTGTIAPLLIALNDPDAQVREKAAIGLVFRRDARVVEPLLKAMGDTDAQVREKVAIALGASGDPRAVSALERALRDPDAQVREKAASGLVLLGLRK